MMSAVKLFIYTTLLVNFLQQVLCTSLPCQPRPHVFPIKKSNTFYHLQSGPDNIFIELYRCSGNTEHYHPEVYRCAPDVTKIDELKEIVHEYGVEPKTIPEQMTFENHTGCVVKCVCDLDVPCPTEMVYNPKCDEGEIWDRKLCGCKKLTDDCKTEHSTGGLTSGISITMFIIALAIEFIIVLVVIYLIQDVCKYRRHGKGVIYKTSQYIRHLSASTADGFKSTTLKRDREATGSVSFLYEVNNGNLPNGRAV